MPDSIEPIKAPVDLVADVHGLLLAATEAMQKIAAAADAVNACVVELEADADKATAAGVNGEEQIVATVKAFHITGPFIHGGS